MVAGQTLKPGGSAIALSRTLISIAVGGTVAITGTSSQLLAPIAPITTTTDVPVLAFGGSTYTADAASAFVIKLRCKVQRCPLI